MDFFENEGAAFKALPGWASDRDRLVQCVWLECSGSGWVETGTVEDMRGTDAGVELFESVTLGFEPVLDGGGTLLGYVQDGMRYEYWDCDEATYSDMHPGDE